MAGGMVRGAAVALLVSGCAVNTYKPAVDTFATATAAAGDAYGAMQTEVLAAHTDKLKAQVRQGALLVKFADRECRSTSERCRLVVMDRDRKVEPLLPELGNVVALLGGIAAYAANLQGIVNSDTPQQVNANLAATAASLQALGTEVTKQGGSQVGPDLATFAGPAGNLIAWVAGEYLNLLQVSALRTATRDADPVIQEAWHMLDRAAALATASSRSAQADQLQAQLAAFDKAPGDRGQMDALASAAMAYDKVLAATSPGVFAAMGKAHGELTRNLAGKDVTLAQALAAVQDFARRAEALHAAIDALRKARVATAAK